MELDHKSETDGYQTDSSLDDESKAILYKAAMKKVNNDDILNMNKEKNIKQIKVKPIKNKNTFSLSEFNKKIEEENKPVKKFISKRAEDKKTQLGLVEENTLKRCFNARLPPYNLIHKK
jgi:vesicle coat complex subunit